MNGRLMPSAEGPVLQSRSRRRWRSQDRYASLSKTAGNTPSPNAKYQVDFCTGLLIVYRLVGQEREEIVQFDLKTVSYYEYVVEE